MGNEKINNEKLDRFYKFASILSAGISVVAIIVSLYTFVKTNQNSQDIVAYQTAQERLPKLIVFGQEIPISVKRTSDEIIDFLDKSEQWYPISLPIHNIGVGIAQNCKAEWEQGSIQRACFRVKKLLEEETSIDIKEFTYEQSDELDWYNYDYIFELEEKELVSIIHYVSKDSGKYVHDSVSVDAFTTSYLVPISERDSEMHISIPDGLSTLLLEAANQNISEPISVNLQVSYQDLAGESFKDKFTVTFISNDWRESDSEVTFTYNISCDY